MSEDDREALSNFIKKRRERTTVKPTVGVDKPTVVPWYKRPLQKDEFKYKLAKNGSYYVRHNEWSSAIWIGPYSGVAEAERIIDSYITESLKNPLDRKCNNNIHSLVINNPSEFF